jgi:tRNA dimethylallyltransferase
MASAPRLVVVGPTASGKSALAMSVAHKVQAHIVAADAFTAYREMDIGTAKPTADDRAAVPHHGIDLFDPSEDATLALWLKSARASVADCDESSTPVIVVGGTGLYVHALIDNFDVPPQYPDIAADLDSEPSVEVLYGRLVQADPVAAQRIEPGNRRRVIRALEVTIGSGRPFSSFGPGVGAFPATNDVFVGLRASSQWIDNRVATRFDQHLEAGLLDEVRRLSDRPLGWSRTARQAIGYKEVLSALNGERSIDEANQEVLLRTRQLVRRQIRWFRRDPRINWIDVEESPDVIGEVLRHWNR